MAFCDYCSCSDCMLGKSYLSHAQTENNKWICDVCYSYDVCMNKQREETGTHNGPCSIENCNHRPKLITSWSK